MATKPKRSDGAGSNLSKFNETISPVITAINNAKTLIAATITVGAAIGAGLYYFATRTEVQCLGQNLSFKNQILTALFSIDRANRDLVDTNTRVSKLTEKKLAARAEKDIVFSDEDERQYSELTLKAKGIEKSIDELNTGRIAAERAANELPCN